jgi:cytochrome c-type biogenesis protein CcmH
MTDAERQDMIQTMVAGLETRLMEQGGTLDEWLRLIRALGVMGGEDRRAAALAIALAAFENDPAAAEKLREAAQ